VVLVRRRGDLRCAGSTASSPSFSCGGPFSQPVSVRVEKHALRVGIENHALRVGIENHALRVGIENHALRVGRESCIESWERILQEFQSRNLSCINLY
jgi:hypothetical protein